MKDERTIGGRRFKSEQERIKNLKRIARRLAGDKTTYKNVIRNKDEAVEKRLQSRRLGSNKKAFRDNSENPAANLMDELRKLRKLQDEPGYNDFDRGAMK